MSQFSDAMHSFVQAVNRLEDTYPGQRALVSVAERELADAGDRLESILREMMREEAHKVSDGLNPFPFGGLP